MSHKTAVAMTFEAIKDEKSESEATTTKAAELKPYSVFWHPDLSWVEVILCLIWPYLRLIPLEDVCNFPPSADSEATMDCIISIRKKLNEFDRPQIKQALKKWSTACGKQAIAEHLHHILRQADILSEWGIVDKAVRIDLPKRDSMRVLVRLPSSLLPEKKKTSEITDQGCMKLDSFDLDDIPEEVPVILLIHPGGFVVGELDDSYSYNVLTELLSARVASKQSTSFVLMTMDYGIAPENPFPGGVVDVLSYVSYYLDRYPNRKFHIWGSSSGGSLATIATLEVHRKYPGRVKSCCAIAPILNPASDSKSYLLNYNSAAIVPVVFLRWAWRAYLSLGPEEDNEIPDIMIDDSEDSDNSNTSTELMLLQQGSTRSAWDKCKWKQIPGTRRLAEPICNIPEGLEKPDEIKEDDTISPPKFVVAANKADPLYDDGEELANALEAHGATVTYIAGKGIHCIGFLVNNTSKQELIKSMADALWG